MANKRRAPRFSALKAGTIKFSGNAIGCLVRNLSVTGAALEVANEAGIPSRFVLEVPGDGLSLACRAMWRRDQRIGVAFG